MSDILKMQSSNCFPTSRTCWCAGVRACVRAYVCGWLLRQNMMFCTTVVHEDCISFSMTGMHWACGTFIRALCLYSCLYELHISSQPLCLASNACCKSAARYFIHTLQQHCVSPTVRLEMVSLSAPKKNQHFMTALCLLAHKILSVLLCLAGRLLGRSFQGLLAACD